ncbi:helix-turn-helix domain-containing protein [Streptomyces antibioticus]|uniref:helix-turn-helix domain-containing protein n=1 Tax=Streptomyces antibioticus TaxID=1890 RepID=UPI0036F88C04
MTREYPQQLPDSAAVVARIRNYRKAQGISAQALADAITADGYRCLRSTLANHEGGRHQTIPVDLVCAAARVLGVPVAVLLSDTACSVCDDEPPRGFTCNACGAGKPVPEERQP